MNTLEALTKIAEWTGWPLVTILTIFACGLALWLFKQRFEILKASNELLKTKLTDAEQMSPTAIVERLASKNKILNDEFDSLHSDFKLNEQRIKEIEKEKEKIEIELEGIADVLCNATSYCKFNCSFCFKTTMSNEAVEFPIERQGEKLIVTIYGKCQKCGHENMSIKKSE